MRTIAHTEAIAKLDALSDGDVDEGHAQADDILLMRLSALGDREVVEAYERARRRVRFWE